MKKKRIAFVINSLGSGGAERVVSTLANELCSKYDIFIITFVNNPVFYSLSPNIQVLYCFELLKPSKNPFQGVVLNYRLFIKLRSIIKKKKIDLLIGFLTTANVLTVLIGRKLGIPTIISERNNPSEQKISRYWTVLRKYCYPRANRMVVQTKLIKSYYESDIHADRLKVIANPIAPILTNYRESHPQPNKQKIVLNVGRLTKVKGHNMLIRAFGKTNSTDWKLIIAGEGPERENLELLIRNLGLSHRVTLPGRVVKIEELYSSAKIFAFSSKYEGMPNALIEAMHFGLLCLSTDCRSGPSELIIHGVNGFLVPVDDESEFAKYLEKSMLEYDALQSYGSLAKSRVEVLSSANIIAKWETLICSLLH